MQQKAIIVGIVSFIVVLVMLLVYLLSVWVKGDLSVIKMLKRSIFVVVTIMMVVGCVYSVIMIIWWIKCIHQNVTGKTSISREYFKELDYLRNHWKETNTLYNPKIASDLLGITYIDGDAAESQIRIGLSSWLKQF